MRYLAIDFGGKRTGLAVGDHSTGIVTALDAIITTHEAERLRQLIDAIDEHGPDALVVGLPLNMDGSEGPPAKAARKLANHLHHAIHLPVHMADERLTSVVADEQMARTGLTHRQKKNRRDGLAAATILRDFLERSND